MDIYLLRTEEDYNRALEEIDGLLDAAPDTLESDRLEILTILVEDYEKKNYPINPPDDPVEVIQFYLEKNGLTRRDLEKYIGSRARVSEILNRKRSLTLPMIQRLRAGLGIPTDLLIPASAPVTRKRSEQVRVDL
jgi:HTH-type transcriptional regulator / antitoxin HigA